MSAYKSIAALGALSADGKPQCRPRCRMRKQCEHIRAPRPLARRVRPRPMFALVKCHYGNSTSLLFSAMPVSLFSPLAE